MAQTGFRRFLAERFGFAPPTEEESAAVVDGRGRQKWGPDWDYLKAELGARFQDIQTGAEIGAGGIANAAAEITGPGPLDSFVPFLRNYQQNLDRELGEQPGFIEIGRASCRGR